MTPNLKKSFGLYATTRHTACGRVPDFSPLETGLPWQKNSDAAVFVRKIPTRKIN